jgi:hypothetical protein
MKLYMMFHLKLINRCIIIVIHIVDRNVKTIIDLCVYMHILIRVFSSWFCLTLSSLTYIFQFNHRWATLYQRKMWIHIDNCTLYLFRQVYYRMLLTTIGHRCWWFDDQVHHWDCHGNNCWLWNDLCFSKCLQSRYYKRVSDRIVSCSIGCRNVTTCGESIVPDEHLYVSNYWWYQICKFSAMSLLSIGKSSDMFNEWCIRWCRCT